MKISIPHLLAGAISAFTGAQQGRLQGQQDALAQGQQDFNQRLQLGTLLQGQQDRAQQEQDRQTQGIGTLLGSDYLDQNSGQALLNQYAQRLTQPPAAGADPYAAARQSPYYQKRLGGVGLPPAPGGGGAATNPQAQLNASLGAPAAAGAPTGLIYQPHGQKAAEAEYVKGLNEIASNAAYSGDAETHTKAVNLISDLTLGKLTLDQAKQQAGQLTLQGRKKNIAQGQLDTLVKHIGDLQASGGITDAYYGKVGKVLEEMQGLGPLDTPEKQRQAVRLQRQWGALSGRRGVLQPNAQVRSLEEGRRVAAFGRFQDQAARIHANISSGKATPEEALSQIQDFHAYASDPLLQQGHAGDHEFAQFGVNLEPQPVEVTDAAGNVTGTRTETPEEVKARNLSELAPLVGNAHDQQNYRLKAYQSMLGFIRSPQFARIQDADQRVSVLSKFNGLAEKANLPGLPADLTAGLTAAEKERLGIARDHQATYDRAQRELDRHQHFMEGIADRNASSAETNASAHAAATEVGNWLKQVQGENSGYDRDLKKWNAGHRMPPAVVAEAAGYQSRITTLSQRIGVLMTGDNKDLSQVAALNKNLQDLVDQRNALLDPYKTGTAPPNPPPVGAAPTPTVKRGVPVAPVGGSTSISPEKKQARLNEAANFQKIHHRAPNAAELNQISRLVEGGQLPGTRR